MRVAVVAGPDPGHLIPAAGLACALADRGHVPLVATGARWSAALAARGLAFAALPLLAASGADTSFGDRLSRRPAEMAPPLAALLGSFSPDVIVADTLTRAGGLAAGLLGLPWVELIPHPLADPSRGLPPYGTGWAPRPTRDRVLRALAARSYARGRREQQEAFRAAGLTDPAPAARLVATLPALEPMRPDWPADTTVVGPLAWEPAAVDLQPPAGDDPLVIVVGSTASGSADDLLTASLAALAGRGFRVASPRFGPYPDRLPRWAAAGPGRLAPLLAAASVVVAPGGHGVVSAALVAGVPMVLLPAAGDQREVARRVARLGAGVVTRPNRLWESVSRVVATPSYAAAAARAGAADLPDPVALVQAAARLT